MAGIRCNIADCAAATNSDNSDIEDFVNSERRAAVAERRMTVSRPRAYI